MCEKGRFLQIQSQMYNQYYLTDSTIIKDNTRPQHQVILMNLVKTAIAW